MTNAFIVIYVICIWLHAVLTFPITAFALLHVYLRCSAYLHIASTIITTSPFALLSSQFCLRCSPFPSLPFSTLYHVLSISSSSSSLSFSPSLPATLFYHALPLFLIRFQSFFSFSLPSSPFSSCSFFLLIPFISPFIFLSILATHFYYFLLCFFHVNCVCWVSWSVILLRLWLPYC